MESPSAYIPMDRRQAMAGSNNLLDRTTGAALFADISGFTPLTESLLKEYGPRRGAEELTRQLNLIYDALVTEVHRYQGSVLAFSGDAITCWFDNDDGRRGTACALDMQQAMHRFEAITMPSGTSIPLAMKVAVATGPVRRFQVGDPKIQFIDALAGATLDHMAEAEHHAEKGEVVVGSEVVDRLGDQIEITEWRRNAQNEQFGVVADLIDRETLLGTVSSWSPLAAEVLAENQIRPWVLPPLYERLQTGKGEFLAELRPAVVLFLYFSGIDYDRDEDAGNKLDAYICWIQQVLAQYEAYPFQLTIGDKGSYLYTAFGAPIAHENDAERAVKAALELQSLSAELDFIEEVQIGISQGQLYTGAYGGSTRRTYGALGDVVNLAARLMQAANSGQILVSETAQQNTADVFSWEELPPFKVKGKAEAVVAFRAEGLRGRQAIHLQEPEYGLPMVGREAELDLIKEKLALVLSSHGQIVGITGEAGMGKSRLVAENIRLAIENNMIGFGGDCQSYGTNISYLVWEAIWRGLFGVDSVLDVDDQIVALEKQLELIDTALVPRLPLLGAVLNISIPDNDLTRSFDAKLRKTSLESLLVDCLRARAKTTPLLIVLEDSHWLDPLSHGLLEVIGRAITDLPVLLVMAYRPLELDRLQISRVNKLPHFSEISLVSFTATEAEQLINLKLARFFGSHTAVPLTLIDRITDRAQGNPFYIEELLNYIHDQGIDPHDHDALAQFNLPNSLHSLILSRIDQLTESQKNVLKVASVIGRMFQAAWLWGMYPELGAPEHVKLDLDALNHMDLAPMDTPEPELSYLFKHIVTQEVAYESLPYATRSMLHGYLGEFIENNYGKKLDQFIDILAFHYDRSQNEVKKRKYLRRAGEAAQEDYNNEAAIDYYQRVLSLLSPDEQVTVMLKLGEVLQLVGRREDAKDLYIQTLTLTEQLENQSGQAWCQIAMGELLRTQRQFDDASLWLERARATFEVLGNQIGIAQVLKYEGTLAWNQGDYENAQSLYEESLAIRRELDDIPGIADLLSNLGLVAHYQGQYEAASKLYEESLNTRYRLGDKWGIAISLNNLGYLAIEQGVYEVARTQLEVAMGLQREIGDRAMTALALHNLANVARAEQSYPEAQAMYEESITINWDLDDREALAYLLADIGGLAALQGQAERALHLTGAAEVLREAVGVTLPPAEKAILEDLLEPVRQTLGDMAATAVAQGRTMSVEQAVEYALQEN